MKDFYEKEFYNNAENYKILQFGEIGDCKFYYMEPTDSHAIVRPAILKINVYGIIENMVISPVSLQPHLSA